MQMLNLCVKERLMLDKVDLMYRRSALRVLPAVTRLTVYRWMLHNYQLGEIDFWRVAAEDVKIALSNAILTYALYIWKNYWIAHCESFFALQLILVIITSKSALKNSGHMPPTFKKWLDFEVCLKIFYNFH